MSKPIFYCALFLMLVGGVLAGNGLEHEAAATADDDSELAEAAEPGEAAEAGVTIQSAEAAEPVEPAEPAAEDLRPDDYRNWSILPLPVTGYNPDLGVILGASAILLYGPDIGVPEELVTGAASNTASLIAMYTTSGSFVLGGGVRQYLMQDRWLLDAGVSFRRTPQDYWGIGPAAGAANPESYTADSYSLRLGGGREFVPNLYLGSRLSYRYYALAELETDGELIGQGVGNGSETGQFPSLGLWLRYDSTEGNASPYRGILAVVELDGYAGLWGSSLDYSVLRVDLRQYTRVHREQVLGVQLLYRQGFGDVPFFDLPGLGGDNIFRGYPSRRFRDMTAVSLQGEYRLPLPGRFGLVGFASVGQVGSSPADLRLLAGGTAGLKLAGGAGVRFRVGDARQGLNLRVDAAFSAEGFGPYINAGEAF
ncbi:BamA/TamA family outer membrane protein [Spirochaeta africana]|uniref:Outer membrane protein/protective antigen OMA87 n=1 Tax=Spirochaeta africana (strain ATCC 700263 / DSM 8902 / Z-7692) TaxID=889378 RepID=H9UGH7_SPIAZ|nr:BamA/TamA family outer membrane protein [Spirochaeta africana]AFG36620.1 outer membrane protein/protective antigen OMA87 [Spirochaeta africana DSM 8902]